ALESSQLGERAHHRIDLLGLQFAAILQQDQFSRRRLTGADHLGKRQQGLTGGRDRRQLFEQAVPGDLDTPANLLLFVRLQKFALADVVQIHPDKIDVFLRYPRGWKLLDPVVFQRLFRLLVESLVVERLRLFLFDQPRRWFDDGFDLTR